MPDSVAISILESAASGLGVLLNDWIHDHIDKPESAPAANTSAPKTQHSVLSAQSSVLIDDLDLPKINDAIQSLWRLVSIHKSIEQLKTPQPAPMTVQSGDPSIQSISSIQSIPTPDALAEFQSTSSTSPMSASADTSLHPASAGVSAHPHPASAGLSRLSSTRLQPSNFSIPSVPSVPTMHSLEAIIAKTQQLYAETASLLSASGLPLPDPDPTAEPSTVDQPVMKLLDIITGRPSFPGSGNSLDSFRADLLNCPP